MKFYLFPRDSDGKAEDRRQNVYELTGWNEDGTFAWDSGNGYDIQGYRTFSTWLKGTGTTNFEFSIHLDTSMGRKAVRYYPQSTGTSITSGTYYNIGIHGKAGDFSEGEWVRLERNMLADAQDAWSGISITRVTGIHLWSDTGGTLRMDGLSFSNSLTVEQNVLGPGVIAHILRNRTINPSNYSFADSWFHYDQVGSVMLASNAAGTQQFAHYQDAWGNVLESWQTGRWDGGASGWHHNTKATDGELGLVYMYQRWYGGKSALFVSIPIYPPMLEPPFSFAGQDPVSHFDPDGEIIREIGIGVALGGVLYLGLRPAFQMKKCSECLDFVTEARRRCARRFDRNEELEFEYGGFRPGGGMPQCIAEMMATADQRFSQFCLKECECQLGKSIGEAGLAEALKRALARR